MCCSPGPGVQGARSSLYLRESWSSALCPLLSVPSGAAGLNFLLCSELADDAKPPPAGEKTSSKLTLSLVKGQIRGLDVAGCGTREMPADVLVLPAGGNYSDHNEE